MVLLLIEDLEAGYGDRRVLRGIDLALLEGEKLVVMGPNGSGKSTLVKAIPLLVDVYRGRIVFDGVDLTSCSDGELRRARSMMGYLPQSYGLFPHMRVIDNVAFPLRVVKGMDKDKAYDRAEEYLKAMGIEDLAQRYPAQLSGGQQQRAALARALAMNPKLLLLDEPTSALDIESRAEVLEALYRIARMGKSMIIVTHEARFALEAADKIAFMVKGEIVEMGRPGELMEGRTRLREFIERMAR